MFFVVFPLVSACQIGPVAVASEVEFCWFSSWPRLKGVPTSRLEEKRRRHQHSGATRELGIEWLSHADVATMLMSELVIDVYPNRSSTIECGIVGYSPFRVHCKLGGSTKNGLEKRCFCSSSISPLLISSLQSLLFLETPPASLFALTAWHRAPDWHRRHRSRKSAHRWGRRPLRSRARGGGQTSAAAAAFEGPRA